ncbi:transport protein particle complex subunit [Encephalitozoon romaleae SJ-2008]|uniref:Trafficking protein particle complex subunit n=1 Tax=Encephalitozoon romaleae (strain SJ-2008) TaxID=1178016 RepID=I6ZIR1_ENCRO|nr:transport protein particle complex subunit [Encephalitozoon romaleae SJ-2008]AFN83113.1 transport protein particle complex subunit [Encephalitozoon romaleae SJ-2008]
MVVEQLFIINKSGGMVFKYEREENTDINSFLILTSSLYSVSVILSKVMDNPASRQVVYFRNRTISIFRTITGLVFVFVADKPADALFERVYSHYCKYVTRDPFYSPEMPIQCSKFRPHLLFEN